jgi:hypothetical protein
MNQLTGSCHCGKIQYITDGKPFDGDYCHCRDCQKITGSPISAWMDFKSEQVTWTKGKPKTYHSSKFIRRGFCENCGSTLTYSHINHREYTTLAITSSDNPNLVQPTYHIYTSSQVDWLCVNDKLPRYKFAKSQS